MKIQLLNCYGLASNLSALRVMLLRQPHIFCIVIIASHVIEEPATQQILLTNIHQLVIENMAIFFFVASNYGLNLIVDMRKRASCLGLHHIYATSKYNLSGH